MKELDQAIVTSKPRSRALKSTTKYDSSNLPHDAFIEPSSEALIALAESIFLEAEALRPPPIRKPRADAMERRRMVLYNLVANLKRLNELSLHKGAIIISLRKQVSTRYDRSVHKDVIRGAVEGLRATGWIEVTEAVFKKRRTAIKPTEKMWKALSSSGEGPHIKRASGAESIVLSAFIRRRAPKQLIDYQDTPETFALRAEMDSHNADLAKADLRYDGKPIYAGYLTRRFQITGLDAPHSFDLMGRVYGPFWMNLSKANRHRITLDDEELADLDFVNMFSSLAYIAAGHSVPPQDAYEGVDGLTRKECKQALLMLLSRREGAMKRLPEDLEAELKPRGWTGKKLEAAIRNRHPAIAQYFSTGFGLKLMKTESDILLKALEILSKDDIFGLAMHDGIMVRQSDKAKTIIAMREASKSVLGVEIAVAEKPIEKGHTY